MERCARYQSLERLPVRAGGLSRDAARGGRKDHQYLVDDVDLRRPFAASYAASKGGIVQLTKSLATAWAKDNIQVNAVLPGWIGSDLTRGARAELPGLNEGVLARTPAGRWGTPADCAGVVVFLASGASALVTGAAIPVDGGYSSML